MAGSPTARRRRLSIELKKLRESHGYTCAQVGEALDWSGSKVNRMETGNGRVQPSDVDALCRFYATNDELREFLKSLARQAKTRGWWQAHGSGVPAWFSIYIGLEQDISTFRQYQCEFVPGLMQTSAYAAELHRATNQLSPEDVERAVRVRMERQAMLARPDAPDTWFIVHESALRNVIGDTTLMREQLERILESMELPRVTLQVLAFDSGSYPATGPFTLLGFPDPEDPDIVYRDGITDATYLEGASDVREYARAFDMLRAAAASPQRSVQVIRSVLKDYAR
ncbi:XRE family transcriptional regulator [Streptomyces sp. WAC05374]|uniref:helix-turn-helix domain-containing protein n=1 Tax=Streptomyces sp. WAC05374 TaxID=2487420 RepID=UPI000F888195|nr:helix-turn-helix transcriptional regulator [Streptomyces sp. WAC05374]RST07613.1 XRE family transcriptional regulator [Streptomyces sp. WAC05374]TDF44327.1 XRE family transcriptional regulator [Streptomyces sp. WAC05374]TDF53743.1 XRE family transcriptional regulator [Streptomyces sp. WAC05374]TDF58576.1 XRE family transcriptional regulator [Streptomyces sp. WAC05374]